MDMKTINQNKPHNLFTLFKGIMRSLGRTFVTHKSCCKVLALIVLVSMSELRAQDYIPLKTVLDSALKFSPAIKSSNAGVSQQKHLLKSSFNLPSPEILLQNPTGNFYTLGVQQVFDFPTIYSAQRKIQKENIKLAEKSLDITYSDIKYQVQVMYVELQYQYQLMMILRTQDSLYSLISNNADSAFKAGTIDFIQSSFAKVQAGQARTSYQLSKANFYSTLQAIKSISGIKTDFIPDSLASSKVNLSVYLDTNLNNNFSRQYDLQQLQVDQSMVQLEKQRLLPGFTLAYLNQGEKSTLMNNRFYAGVRIPLWFWQFKGEIEAAKSQAEASKYTAENNLMLLKGEMNGTYSKYLVYSNALAYYDSIIIPDVDALIKSSFRFHTSGNASFSEYLRNMNDAIEVRKNYLETLRNYNQTIIYIQYLNGSI